MVLEVAGEGMGSDRMKQSQNDSTKRTNNVGVREKRRVGTNLVVYEEL